MANGDFSQVSNVGKPVAYKLQGAVHFGKVGIHRRSFGQRDLAR